MATPNNYDARGIIDFLSKLDPEMANVLNGEAMVTRIKEEFKNQSEKGRKAAERMAKNLRDSGNNISAQLQEVEREASKAGYNIFFSYNEGRKQIDIKMERRAGVNGDKKASPAKIQPVKFNIDVGSVKAGYNNGVPSTKSLSVQGDGDYTYFATEAEDVLRGLKEALVEINKNERGENKSTAYANSKLREANKKAMKGLVAHTNHASVNNKYFDDDRYEGDSRRRQLYMRNNAKMAGLIDNAMKKILGEKKKFTTTSDKKKEIDVNQLQRDLLIYIEARQKKNIGKDIADGILKGRGYSESDINNFIKALGEDILSISNTMNLGSDRSMATLTESYEGARDMLLSTYGDSSRHITQGRNTIEKINGGKRRKITFREAGLQSEGYYNKGFDHEAYTSVRVTPEKIQEIYLNVKNKIANERRADIKSKHKNWKPHRIEKEVEKQLRQQGFLKDFDPSVDDDMMIVKESSLKNLKSTRLRSTKIDDKEFKYYSDQIAKKIQELTNDGKKSINLGNKKYDLTNDKDKEEYKNKLLISRVISGLNPKEIYGNVSISDYIDENGKQMYSLSAKQIVGGGQQEKVVTGIGERNYGFAMNDGVFNKIVEQMVSEGLLPEGFKKKNGERLDFIRSKDGFKSNEMAQLAISRLSYLFGKTSDKNSFVDKLKDKNHPLSGLIKGITKDGTGIEFDQSNDKLTEFANINGGGLNSLYRWMENTKLRDLGIDEEGMVFDPKSDSFIYETTAGLADVFKWTKRVQTGSKERDAQDRTAFVSGSSDAYKKRLKKRYEGSNERDRKEIEKAESDIKEIQDAITKKNTATKNMSDEEVDKFIREKSYIAGSKDNTKTAITMGVGDKYTINTDNYKDIVTAYERGHLSQDEFDKTWEAEVQRIKEEMIASGIDASSIETIIDPGQQYGFSAFDKQYNGRLLHLGNTSVDAIEDLINPEKMVYNRSEYSSAASSLFRAMGSNGEGKESRVSEAATALIKDMFVTSYSNKGALNERANKRRLGHSASFKTSGISPEQIDEITDGIEKNRLIDSAFISEEAMKSLLRDTHDYEKNDGSIDEDEYLRTLYAQYSESDKFKIGGKKAVDFNNKKWGSTFKEKQTNLIKEIMKIAKTEGLRGMFNRFPSIDSEAVKNSRLFISDNIKSKDVMKVGSGLAKSINADFDGDTINVILKMLQDYSGDNTEQWDKAIMQRVYKMRGGKSSSKTEDEKNTEYQKALGDADDTFLKDVSGLAAKVNNQYIGNFSNMSTSIRNALGNKGYDERNAIYTDGKMNQASFEKIAKGLIVKALGQTLEQDAISAKKVEQRIVEEIISAKEQAKKEGREFTDAEKNSIAIGVINDFDKLSSDIRDGSFKNDNEIIDKLNNLGITKAIKDKNTGNIVGHEFDSLAMTTAIAQIQEMAKKNDINPEIITKMFGGIDITSDDFNGKLDSSIVSNIVSSTSKSIYGNKKGFFYKGDQYNPAAAVARENNPGAHADQQQITKISDNIEDIKKIKEGNAIFGERGEILEAVANAYKYEIGMEEKKIGVALREADAIKKAGKSWKDYSDLISKKYKLDEEAEKVAGKGDFYVASNKVLSEGGFTRTTPSAIKNILNPRTDSTTGLDKSVLNDRVAKGLFKPKKGELVKAFGVDSEKTLMSLFNTSQSIIGGNLAHSIAQGDKTGVKEFETELKNLLSVFGKSAKEIETVISAFQKAGTNMSAIADNFGVTVGNELPIAGVSTDGNYLINGRMDTLRYQKRQNQYTGKMDDVYTILDYKTRASTGIKHDDVAQVVMYQEMFKDMQKTWMTDDRFKGMSDKDLLDVARVDIAKSLSGGERSKEAIDNLVNSLTEEDINRIRNGARIESGVVVGDSRGGASQAYKISGSVTSDIKDMVMGGDWEKLSPDQIAALLSMQQKITSPDFYKEGNYVAPKKEPEKPKTKDDKEAEKKKNQEDFVKLLEQEYKLRLKIAELKGRKALSTNDEEKKNLETLIGYNEGLLNKKVAEREKAGKKTGLRGKSGEVYKNNVLSAEEAKYQLELQKLAERLTKGTVGIAGKKGLFSDFGKQFKGYFVNMFSAYRIISKITQELRKCVQIAKELDKAATNIRIVTGMTSKEVDGLMRKYTGLARELGVTTQVIAQSGAEWMRQGYSAEQANDLIIASTKLSKLGMMDMNNATKVLTSTMKGFKLEASEVGSVVDKLTKLDMNYATTAADIGEAMSRTAAIANQMGVSLDETAAMVTTIMDITQQSAEMTGTAIRTILSRYGNVKAGSFVSMMTDGEDLDKINDIEKVLSALGIEIRESALDMKNIGSTLDELAIKWVTLSDVEKNAVATAFAGTRQRNQFIVLMDSWKQVEEATEMAANSAGTADEKYGAYMDSIEARLNKLQTAWEGFTQKLGTSKLIKGAVSALTLLVENLDKILKLVTSLGAYFGAKKLFGGISNKFGLFGGVIAKTSSAGGQGGISGMFNKIFNRTATVNQKGFTDVNYKLQQIISLMQSKNMQDAVQGNNKNITQAFTSKERRNFIKANNTKLKNLSTTDGLNTMHQKVQNNTNLTDANKANLNALIERRKAKVNQPGFKSNLKTSLFYNRTQAENRALKGLGYQTQDGQIINKKGGEYYSTKVGSDGKPITTKIDKNSPEAKGAKAQTATKAVGNVAMGLMAGLSYDSSQHQIGGSMYKAGETSINDVETTKGEDIAYKTIHAVGSTALNFIPFVGPIVSAVFGPMLTDLFTGLIKWAIHADEMERKERVRIAKENLEALKKIEDATAGVKSAIYDMDTFEDVKKAQEAVDDLVVTLLKDGDNRREIMNALGEKFVYAINEATNQTTMSIDDLEKILLYGTEEQKKLAVAVIDTVVTANQADNAAASQEEEVWKAEEKLEDAEYSSEQTKTVTTTTLGGSRMTSVSYSDAVGNNILDSIGVFSKKEKSFSGGKGSNSSGSTITRTLAGDTNEERYENALLAIKELTDVQSTGEYNGNKLTDSEKEWLDEEIKKLEKYVEEYTKYEGEIEKLNKELHPKELAAAFNKAGLSLWDSIDVANSSLEGVIQRMADDLELTGVVVRDYTGQITSEARNQIETYLRSNEQFSSLFNNSTTTLNDIISKFGDQADLLNRTGASSFDELKEAFDKQDAEKIETFTKNMYGASNATDEFKDKLMDLVYSADTSKLSYFARSLNMTTDQVLALQDKLGSVTLADLIKSPEETRESFNELASMFSELSNGGKLTGESLEKLNSSYFTLYNTYDSKGKIISTSSDNLLGNLRERLFGNENIQGTQAFLYQNATFQELKGNSNMYDAFLASLKKDDIWNALEDEDRNLLNGANTLSDVIQLFNSTNDNGEGMQRVLSKFLDELGINNDYYKELQESLINWQKHENQTIISGLESQIDALEDINKEREKEIELIKAKEALENAKKEKKRVYRAGVGWTYESNQEEVTKAKDNLDELEREQSKENLQYQIDLLEKQNSMLDNISKNEELKALKNVFDEYNSYMKNKFGKEVSNGFSQILDLGEAQKKMTWSTYVTNMGTEQAYGEEKDYQTLIDSARQVAYLDSILNGAFYNENGSKKTDAEIEEIKHSSDYIAKQQARNEAAASFLSARKNLESAGVKVGDMSTRLNESLDLSGDAYSGLIKGVDENDTESKNKIKNGYLDANNTDLFDKIKENEEWLYLYGKDGQTYFEGKGKTGPQSIGEGDRFIMKPGESYSEEDITDAMSAFNDEENRKYVRLDWYNRSTKSWETITDPRELNEKVKSGDFIHMGVDKSKSSDASGAYAMRDGSRWRSVTTEGPKKLAKGTFGLTKDIFAMINELGTEGIITPSGTLTALPSKTGVVPADLTKNLYDLGEVAPNLIKKLGDTQVVSKNNSSSLEDNSMNVENLYATFETESDFDFEKLLISARQYIKNTKGVK